MASVTANGLAKGDKLLRADGHWGVVDVCEIARVHIIWNTGTYSVETYPQARLMRQRAIKAGA